MGSFTDFKGLILFLAVTFSIGAGCIHMQYQVLGEAVGPLLMEIKDGCQRHEILFFGQSFKQNTLEIWYGAFKEYQLRKASQKGVKSS